MDSPTQVDARIGLVLNGRYTIVELLGEGGMGVVYRGRRLQLDRPVAIKFLHSPYATSAKFVARFEREARAMSRLSHPCCVSVIDFGMEDAPYIVMDFAPGDTLRTVLDHEHFSPQRAAQVTRQVLTALAHAHGHGIIHRDIKPGNIMLGEATGMGDHVRIFDFGLAKLLDPSDPGDPSVTGVLGTPAYMAPEQTRGDKLDARVDLYATGIVLFELLTGQKPFDSPDTLSILRMHREQPPPRLKDLGITVSAELEAVIAKALQKDPAQRFQTAADFMAALDAVPEITGRPSSPSKVEDSRALAPTQSAAALRGAPPTPPRRLPARRPTKARWPRVLGGTSLALACAVAVARYLPQGNPLPKAEAPFLGPAGSTGSERAVRPPPASPAPADREPDAVPAPNEGPAEAPDARPGPDAMDGGIRLTDTDASLYEPSEQDLAEADRALDDPADVEAVAPAGDASDVRSLSDVRALIDRGKIDEAILGLRTLRGRYPSNPELPYLLGNLYFQKGFWSDGLSRYRQALRLRSSLKNRELLQQNTISALGVDKTYARARALLLRDLRSSATDQLRHAQKHHPSRVVRVRAQLVLNQLRPAKRTVRRRRTWFW